MTASALARSLPTLSYDEYLQREAQADFRSEYYCGIVYTKSGGTNRHHIIAGAAHFQLARLLAKRKCFVFTGAARIATPNFRSVFYPDASVHCEPTPAQDALTNKAPILIVEVFSPSTRRYDLTTKRKEYFRIPSLRHYLLIDSETPSVLLYTRDANQTWPKDPQTFTDPKATIPLTALKINLKLKDLYRQTGLL